MYLFQSVLLFALPLLVVGRRVFIYPEWWTNMPMPVLIDGYEYNTIWEDGVHLNESTIWSLYHCAHRKGFNITIVTSGQPESMRARGRFHYHKILWNSQNKTLDARKNSDDKDIAKDAIRTCYDECQVPYSCYLHVYSGTIYDILRSSMPRSWNDWSSDESSGSYADMYYDETTTEESEEDEGHHSPLLSLPAGQRSTFLAEAPTSTMDTALPTFGQFNIMFPMSVSGASSAYTL